MTEKTKRDEHLMPDLSRPRTPLEYLRLFFSGFAMGASDIVPGVSGGTMAFILGVYETLLNAIKSFNFEAMKKALGLFNRSDEETTVLGLIDHIHLRFLIPLGLGLLTAIFALSTLLESWIQTQPTYIFAFFGGLIIASVVAIGWKVRWGVAPVIGLVAGTVVAFLITNPALGTLGDQFGHGYGVLFVSGMIAICAMILPGISGSFILLILGQYEFVLGAVRGRDFVSLFFVAIGAVIGLLAFSRVLSWLLKHYEQTTIAVLVGFMLGSMRLILYRATNLIDEETEAVTALNLDGTQIAIALALALVGFLLVSFIDHLQSRSNPIFALVDRRQPQAAPEA